MNLKFKEYKRLENLLDEVFCCKEKYYYNHITGIQTRDYNSSKIRICYLVYKDNSYMHSLQKCI